MTEVRHQFSCQVVARSTGTLSTHSAPPTPSGLSGGGSPASSSDLLITSIVGRAAVGVGFHVDSIAAVGCTVAVVACV